ncbi:MAG: hypothetical protein J6Y24_16235 [Bacteroidales bacterium]|nr:hypothetical protein [Bacteroidales bacterium]
MAYEYNDRTGNFENVPDSIPDGFPPIEDKDNDDISTILKIVFATVEISSNYFAYQIGWGWLFFTIPVTFYCLVPLIEKEVVKSVKIRSFIGFVLIMITVLTPLPWWSILIAVVAAGILVSDGSNKLL